MEVNQGEVVAVVPKNSGTKVAGAEVVAAAKAGLAGDYTVNTENSGSTWGLVEAVMAYYFAPLEELEGAVVVGMKTRVVVEAVVDSCIVVVDEGVEFLEGHNYYAGNCNLVDTKKEPPEQPHRCHQNHHY